MIKKTLAITAFAAAAALAACNGTSTSGGTAFVGPPPTSPPHQSNMPVQQNVAGAPAFVDPKNNRTLYFLDVDTPTGGTCTGGCLSVWLPLVPSQGAQGQDGFTVVTRSDGTGMQWDFKKHPLYTFTGDSGPDQSNGDGLAFAGGHWHIARPTTK